MYHPATATVEFSRDVIIIFFYCTLKNRYDCFPNVRNTRVFFFGFYRVYTVVFPYPRVFGESEIIMRRTHDFFFFFCNQYEVRYVILLLL